MGLGSYLRFFVGLLLSIEVVREMIGGYEFSIYILVLATLFLILTMWFILERVGVVPRV